MSSTENPMVTRQADVTQGCNQLSRRHIHRLLLCSALVVGALLTGQPSGGWAQMAASHLGTPLQEGIMTGIGTNSIQIDRVDYPIHPKIVVKVAPGAPWSLDALPVRATVRFHVTEGQIDLLIYVPNN